MGQTITEKILAKHAGRTSVEPGENVWVNVDVLMTHDVCGPGTIGVFEREFGKDAKVFDPEKIVLVPDHYIFTKDEMCHRNIETIREFAQKQGIKYHYDPGTPTYTGVCHVTLPQEGHTRPGEVLLGTDSHTCTHGAVGEFASGIGNTDAGFVLGTGKVLLKIPASMKFIIDGELGEGVMAKDVILHIIGKIGVDGATYRAMEFAGSAIENMPMEERMTICNMAIEAGGKSGIIAPDDITREYLAEVTDKPYEVFFSDDDAIYFSEHVIPAEEIVPCVAKPHSPDNYSSAKDCSDIKIDRVYIGSCTGGKTTDFIAAAKILDGQKVCVDTFIVPATVKVEKSLETEKINDKTLKQIFEEAGCLPIAPPSCAACLGGPVDTFGRTHGKEVVVATTNRNFPGRMGSKDSFVYLASPYTAAASAIKGKITDPRTIL